MELLLTRVPGNRELDMRIELLSITEIGDNHHRTHFIPAKAGIQCLFMEAARSYLKNTCA